MAKKKSENDGVLFWFSKGIDYLKGVAECVAKIQKTFDEKNKTAAEIEYKAKQQEENLKKEQARLEQIKHDYELKFRDAENKAEDRRIILELTEEMIEQLKTENIYTDISSDFFVTNPELRKDYTEFTKGYNMSIIQLTKQLSDMYREANKTRI